MNVNVTIDINAPTEQVWAVLFDVENWPQWTPSVTTTSGARSVDETHASLSCRTPRL
jgi:uncharacterized membrane protein